MEARGIRNNNPLNIRRSADKWQGQINAITPNPSFPEGKGHINGNDSSPRGGREGVFCQFESMAYGWRAAFRLLCHTYYGKYKLRTIRDIIYRWAPPTENNTEGYIDFVCRQTKYNAGCELKADSSYILLGIAMAAMETSTQLHYLEIYDVMQKFNIKIVQK